MSLTKFNSHTSPWGGVSVFQSCTSYVVHTKYIPEKHTLLAGAADGAVSRGRCGARIGVAKPVLGVPFTLTNAPGDVSDRPTVLVVTNMKP